VNVWWLGLLIGFWNLCVGNWIIAILVGGLCLIFGEFE